MAGSDKVSLGSVGLGWWGSELAAASARSGAAQVAACFARSELARKAFSEKHGCRESASFEDILKDPGVEGLLIATPHSTHADFICQAASAGKHVFVEKPLTLSVADAKRATEACSRAGVTLQVGHHRRRLGATRRIRVMIDKGELGMIHQLEANQSGPININPRQGWRNDPAECPLGGMTGMGVHMVDNLHYLAGPVKRVCAFSKKLGGGALLDDVTSFILEFESGPLGHINSTAVIPRLCIASAFGTGGNAWSEQDGAKLYFQKSGEATRAELPVEAGDPLADEIAEFARCIREGAVPETGAREGTEVVAVLEALIESVKSRRVVEVSDFRG